MLTYKLLLFLNEGLIFGLFAFGLYVSFCWLRFPDLTPDGSFVLGGCAYVTVAMSGWGVFPAIIAALVAGMLAGFVTAALNQLIKIPTVISGLLVSTALYSISWMLLGKPNQFLETKYTLVGNSYNIDASWGLFLWLALFLLISISFLSIFGQSIWGLRIRAIGENPRLAHDLRVSKTLYTFAGLGIANALVALAGALFIQRSFSVDINMGVGQTIIGLIGMILGLLLSKKRKNIPIILICIACGAIIHKGIIMLTLEAGMPAESFKFNSAFLFVMLFFVIRVSGTDFLRDLKWS